MSRAGIDSTSITESKKDLYRIIGLLLWIGLYVGAFVWASRTLS